MLNGRFPDSALKPIPGGRLAKGYAERWNTMCFVARAHGAATPMPNGSMSSYRTYAQQVFLRNQWCARGACQNAAVPGTSNHGVGRAVDTNQRDRAYQYGERCCAIRPPSDAPWEGWHTLVRIEGHITPMPSGPRTIRHGAHGKDVVHAKKLLRTIRMRHKPKRHYYRFAWGANNYFGAHLRTAVRAFQKDHGLHADGVIGPNTWSALEKAAKTHH